MDVALAGPEDLGDLARLLWLHAAPDEQDTQTRAPETSAHPNSLAVWWSDGSSPDLTGTRGGWLEGQPTAVCGCPGRKGVTRVETLVVEQTVSRSWTIVPVESPGTLIRMLDVVAGLQVAAG